MASVAACTHEFLMFYGCLIAQPAQNFQCDEDGIAAIREGFCDKEQEAAIGCMEQKVRP